MFAVIYFLPTSLIAQTNSLNPYFRFFADLLAIRSDWILIKILNGALVFVFLMPQVKAKLMST